ncbi:zinc-ribbon domain-containing protein [Candidatus Woesearchaeota archaeon]|nr:zinc-ribbon domain-containing protein [Candidatus Woesearchaeota archaeon]
MKCQKCGKENREHDSFCRNCGESTGREAFECECGADVGKEDNYCGKCGMKFEGVEEAESDE